MKEWQEQILEREGFNKRDMETTKIQAAKYYAFLAVASSVFIIAVLSIAKLGAILLNTTL